MWDVTQAVEYQTFKKVGLEYNMVGVVQLARTSDCGSEGREFESRLSPHNNEVCMKAKLKCPVCDCEWEWGYWKWIWKSQFHWLKISKSPIRVRDYRRTKCPNCESISWIARNK